MRIESVEKHSHGESVLVIGEVDRPLESKVERTCWQRFRACSCWSSERVLNVYMWTWAVGSALMLGGLCGALVFLGSERS